MSQHVAILIVNILTGYLLLNSSNSYGTAPPPSKSSYLLNEALSYHKAGEHRKAFILCKDLLDKFNGLKVYRLAAELGHIEALHYISEIYKNGEGVAVDHVKSISYLTTAAELGDAVAV
ncbi:hypothetical protein [Alteromonas sp. S015]|uniref:hypothetical protein n=1 Tax=Alteromonas sp. S015 TaxID=3117401 RepID=UPI002FE337B7